MSVNRNCGRYILPLTLHPRGKSSERKCGHSGDEFAAKQRIIFSRQEMAAT